jgi:D-serine deaminase-like pyridoxal phosphate-dependent protein
LLDGVRLPQAIVDLDAFDHNLGVMLERLNANGLPLRLATKSVRVPELVRRVQDRAKDALRGLMCFSAEEADFLAGEGFDRLLVAYPTLQGKALDALARRAKEGREVSVAVDSPEAALAASAAAGRVGVTLDLVFCVDMSWEPVGPGAHIGVLRSPLQTPEHVAGLARRVKEIPNVRCRGLLAYEAQVAGLQDDSPFSMLGPVMGLIRRRSMVDVAKRRVAMVEALRAEGVEPSIVNGGGTGSIDMSTPATGVNEVAAGSGLYKSHLFDYYSDAWMRRLRPSLFFALEAVRRPTSKHVTCAGGGYVASGGVGPDKHAIPWSPPGVKLVGAEMTGEVQTPLLVPDGVKIDLGAPVIFRPSKAGEPLERFAEVVLVEGGRIVGSARTYRGLGQTYF